MKDEQTISTFMEPKPEGDYVSTGGWWTRDAPGGGWDPVLATCPELEQLGRIFDAEERLLTTDIERWVDYGQAMERSGVMPIHADARSRIRLLGPILRSLLEKQ